MKPLHDKKPKRAASVRVTKLSVPTGFAITIGADPELMVAERATGRIVSSIPILKQTKENPIDLGDGIKFYSDNVLAELASNPVPSADKIADQFRIMFQRAQQCLGKQYRLVPRASHVYDADQLKDPQAIEIGCHAEYIAYSGEERRPSAFTSGLRSGSYHVHVGYASYATDPEGPLMTRESKEQAVRLMDIYVGCSSVVFDKDETAKARRALYGLPSSHRPTPYGFEYRVLGPYPLRLPALVTLVGDLTTHAMSHVGDGTAQKVIDSVDENEVQSAIMDNDLKLARRVLTQAALPKPLLARVEQDYDTSRSFEEAWGIKV